MAWIRNLGIPIPAWIQGGAGSQWPPADQLARLYGYERYTNLYIGDHESVYIDTDNYSYDDEREYLICNRCAEITDLLVSRLFGEPLQVTGPENSEEWLQYLWQNSEMDMLLVQLATGVSYRGDGVLKVRYNESFKAVTINSISPSIYFPETDPDDATRILSATLGWIVYDEDSNPYLFQEIHSPGLIQRRLYTLRGTYPYTYEESDRIELSSMENYADLLEEELTGIDEMLLIPVAPHSTDEPDIWGTSDYGRIDSLQGELNNRYTQRAEILDRHAEPWMTGPPIADDEGAIDYDRRYIEISSEGQLVPNYLVWDGQLAAAQQEIAELKDDMVRNAGLSPESFATDTGGGAISGRALKLRQWRTAATVRARQRVYGPVIRQAISVASKLAQVIEKGFLGFDGSIPVIEPEDIVLDWQDGLPNDDMETAEQETLLTSAGLTSKRSAVARLNPGMTEEQLDEEMAAIAADSQGGVRRIGLSDVIQPVAQEVRSSGRI